MSRLWTRARWAQVCGRCGARIDRGQPCQRIILAGVRRERRRCAACAEGPVPPDLPADPVIAAHVRPMVSLRFLTGVPYVDWKRKAAGDDDARDDVRPAPPLVYVDWVPED